VLPRGTRLQVVRVEHQTDGVTHVKLEQLAGAMVS
jgi:hypothetical protein